MQLDMGKSRRTRVFISYSHEDRGWLDRLQVHLKAKENQGIKIDWWADTKIKAGTKWREGIKEAVETAKVAVLLVSADFLASDFISKEELPPLLAAAAEEDAVILLVIIQPVDLKGSALSEIQSINDPKRPLGKLRTRYDRDVVWLDLVNRIVEALQPPNGQTVADTARKKPRKSTVTPEPEPAPAAAAAREEPSRVPVSAPTAPPVDETASLGEPRPLSSPLLEANLLPRNPGKCRHSIPAQCIYPGHSACGGSRSKCGMNSSRAASA
jgi:TIR domain